MIARAKTKNTVRVFPFLIAASIAASLFAPLIFGAVGPWSANPVMSVSAAAEDSFSISGPIELSAAPRLVLESGTLAAGDASGPVEAFAKLLAGGRAALSLDDATMTVDLGAPPPGGRAEPESAEGLAPLLVALAGARFASVRLRRATVVLRKEDGTAEKLVGVEGEVVPRHGALDARLTFTFRGETLSLAATLGPGDPAGQRGLKLKLEGAPLVAALDGSLATAGGLEFVGDDAVIAVPNVARVARWLGAPGNAGDHMHDLRATGRLVWSGRGIALEDSIIGFDGNKGQGSLTLSHADAAPALEGTLAFERFDVTPYFSGARPGPASSGGGDRPLSIPPLGSFDADLRLSAEHVVLHGVDLGGGAASLSLAGGHLMADIAEMTTALGGTGGGQVSLDMTGAEPRLGIRGKFDALDGRRATEALFGHAVLDGPTDATVDLTASGGTGDRLLATLAGEVAVELPDGGEIGLDAEAAASIQTGETSTGWGGAAHGRTSVDWLLGRFTLDAGVVTARSVTAGAGARQLSAKGMIDLRSRTVDLRLTTTPRDIASKTDAVAPGVSIAIEGPWSEPRLKSLDPVKAARPIDPVPAPPVAAAPDRG